MNQFGSSRGEPPAFKLLEPAQRVVMGLIAAIGVTAAGYFIFVPLSDSSAIQLARHSDAGSSGYAGGNERLAAASRRAAAKANPGSPPAGALPPTQTAGMPAEVPAPI